jgi:hypothetical protein
MLAPRTKQILQPAVAVEFDPSIKAHRMAVAKFMIRNAWADTNIRFTHDSDFGSVPEQVCTKMLRWYMAKDSGLRTKKVSV